MSEPKGLMLNEEQIKKTPEYQHEICAGDCPVCAFNKGIIAAAEYVRLSPTDGKDKWYFYNLQLAKAIQRELSDRRHSHD